MRKILKLLQLEKAWTGIWWLKLSSFFFLLILPTQFGIHFWPHWAYVFGLRIDYLSPVIYLSDVVFLILFVFFYKKLKVKANIDFRKKWKLFFVFGIFILLNTLFSLNVLVTLYRWIKVLEWGMAAWIVHTETSKLEHRAWIPFLISTVIVFMVSLLQFINGHTVGGLFYFLGERSFNVSTPGIALVNVLGGIHMRAYSVFSHPNSMAGFELVVFFLFLRWRKKSKLIIVGILLSLFCVLLSFSKAAYATLIIGSLIYFLGEDRVSKYYRYIVIFLFALSFVFLLFWRSSVFNFTLPISFESRGELFYVASQLFVRRPILGVGLGAFVGEYSSLQPVHNIFVLVLVETGVIGLITFFVVLTKLVNRLKARQDWSFLFIIFTCILITGLFDHYSLTLQQNFLLTAFLTGLIL